MYQKLKVKKIESNVNLDPDFGDLQPEYVDAYMISVTPKKGTDLKNKFDFITLLPDLDNEEETKNLLSEVMNKFLVKGDKYTVREFNDDKIEEYISGGSYSPVISFDPSSLEDYEIRFLWLVPPKHLMQ